MSGVIIAAIISALIAAGSGIASYINTKKTNEQNQQNYEDWKSYNTPENQMQRLRDAGLNPYLVSNVGNTLSQPFQVGSNNGIAEALSGVANVASGATQYAGQAYQKDLDRQLQRDSLMIQERKNDLNLLGLQIREKLANNAIKLGDYRSALLATQGSIAELNRRYLYSTLPYRTNSALYDSLYKGLQYNYYKELFPKQLQYYEPMQRAMINNILARSAHLNWYEDFAMQQFIHNSEMDYKRFYGSPLGWASLGESAANDYRRYGLSRDYFDLAKDKFHWNMMNDVLDRAFPARGKMKGVYKHSPGSYPEYIDYTY